MILTALKPVNIRLERPSVNAPNPSFLLKGDQVNAIKRLLGDIVNDDNEWIFTDKNNFVSAAGFPLQEKESIPLDISNSNLSNVFKDLEIVKLWSAVRSKGNGVSIGIIDRGVNQNPMLNNKVVPVNYDFSPNDDLQSHGTYMASIISAYDVKNGEVGIAPLVNKIYSYKIKNFSPSEILDAINELIKYDISIINMSFSSNAASADFNKVKEKIKELNNSNIICISSSGNESVQNEVYPSALDGIISVAGYDLSIPKRSWNGSNIWAGINISAPYNNYFQNSFLNADNKGTSVACAILTGIIACSYFLIKEKAKNKTIYTYLKDNVFPLLPKVGFLNQLSIPAYVTNDFINCLNN